MKSKFIRFILFTLITFIAVTVYSQSPPHPNGGGGPTGGNIPVGGSAPIDGGLVIMLALGAVYSAKKKFSTKE